MNDTLKAAGRIGAELGAAKAEVERLRGLLEELHPYVRGCSSELWDRYHATLSQQAEPVAVNQCDGCQAGVPVDNNGNHRMGKPGGYADLMRCEKARYVSEPAPAQDEREPVGWYTDDHLTDKSATTYDREVADRWRGKGWPVYELYARPAQTEQQPTAVPEGWLIELGFDVLDRPFRFVDSKSHTPTIKVILPACEPDDSSSWDLRDEIARRIGSVLAAPIAQTVPQPEQSETVLVPVSVIEEAAHMLEAHSPGSGSVESFTAQDLRAALSTQGTNP